MTLHRLPVMIPPPLMARLRKLALKTGAPLAELVRRALTQYLRQKEET